MISGGKKIRVLVVDDSAFMRKVMHGLISSDPAMEVVGEAGDGRDAVALADSLRPDVISMDINMPHVDGLQATEIIMSQNPRPIVIVSSESREGTRSTLRALELGAIDFVSKPTAGVDLDMNTVREELMRKLKLAAKVRVVRTATRPKLSEPHGPRSVVRPADGPVHPPAPLELPLDSTGGSVRYPVVVLAASTGGPAALMRLVPAFRKDFPGVVLLALHMPASFTS